MEYVVLTLWGIGLLSNFFFIFFIPADDRIKKQIGLKLD